MLYEVMTFLFTSFTSSPLKFNCPCHSLPNRTYYFFGFHSVSLGLTPDLSSASSGISGCLVESPYCTLIREERLSSIVGRNNHQKNYSAYLYSQ